MKKQLKKADGLATIIITVVLVILAVLIIPTFRNLQKTNTQNTKQIDTTMTNRLTTDLELSNGKAGYDYIE